MSAYINPAIVKDGNSYLWTECTPCKRWLPFLEDLKTKKRPNCTDIGVMCSTAKLISDAAIDFLIDPQHNQRPAELWMECTLCHKWRWIQHPNDRIVTDFHCAKIGQLSCTDLQMIDIAIKNRLLGIKEVVLVKEAAQSADSEEMDVFYSECVGDFYWSLPPKERLKILNKWDLMDEVYKPPR